MQSFTYKQRPGPEQVDLRVETYVPGSWFTGLNPAERKESYRAVAVEYEQRHAFEKSGTRKSTILLEGIRFLSPDDAGKDAAHTGFWMPLRDWNRYRHDTYKDNPKGEEHFLPSSEICKVPGNMKATPAADAEETQLPLVYSHFTFVKKGTHTQNVGKSNEKIVPCEWWECKNNAQGCCRGRQDELHKVVLKGTTGLLRHVKLCYGMDAWVKCRMANPGSKARQGVCLDSSSLMTAHIPSHDFFVFELVHEIIRRIRWVLDRVIFIQGAPTSSCSLCDLLLSALGSFFQIAIC